MNNLKKTLIHWLGGVTIEESKQNAQNTWYLGLLNSLYEVKEKMNKLYGIPADDWCNQMYRHVDSTIESLEQIISNQKAADDGTDRQSE